VSLAVIGPRIWRAKSAPDEDAGNPRIGKARVTEDELRGRSAAAGGDGLDRR